MATNLHLNDRLVNKAVKLGGHRTRKAAVTQALVMYVNHLEQQKIIPLFGTMDYEADYDHKKQRVVD